MVLILLIISLPLIILFGFPALFTKFCHEECDCFYNSKGCRRVITAIPIFLLGLILNIIVAPLAVLSSPFVLIYTIVWYFKERLRMKREYKNNIRLKKLNEIKIFG